MIYGIDLSSGAAVAALDAQSGQRVLDLCAAPGAKLSMIADRMKKNGHLVAVDVSPSRIQVCKSIVCISS